MIFISKQAKNAREEYFLLLKSMASLTGLFSDSKIIPYLYYRGHENAFCRAFSADNLSRADVSADASKNSLGIGLKTYLEQKGNTMQKVAEFNKSRDIYKPFESDAKKLAKTIAEMRNKRLQVTKDIHGLENLIYHCVTRLEGKMYIIEEPMDCINLNEIEIIKKNSKTVSFQDSKNEYKFSLSKSTLYKRFNTNNPLSVDVIIPEDPFEIITEIFKKIIFEPVKKEAFVILPLYSKKGEKHVPERSGLNQWNAKGRLRQLKEVYIPIPSWIHRVFPKFFPDRNKTFKLVLPDKKELSASVCQENGKALMSNPNTDLGEWLIDDILKIEEGKIVDYNLLQKIGIDSVIVTKISDDEFRIDFKKLDSYEDFEKLYKK